MQRTPFVGGNWKMNTRRDTAAALAREVEQGLTNDQVEVVVYPPFVYLDAVAEQLGGRARLGAQDFWPQPDGAFTGEVSLAMLHDCGVSSVLVGHSERRHIIGEDDHIICGKVKAACEANFQCILCIGELREQRERGETDAVNRRQLHAALDGVRTHSVRDHVVIAYEPVWAIGTGLTATPSDAQAAHHEIRDEISRMYDDDTARSLRIIYGGSVKPENAGDLFMRLDIDGFLVGGASLIASDFLEIIRAAAS